MHASNNMNRTLAIIAAVSWFTILNPFSGAADTQGERLRLVGIEKPIIRIQYAALQGVAGHGYRLEYTVPLPIEVYWRFKTDFGGRFVTTNRFISKHRLVSMAKHTAVTETVYAVTPGRRFIWKTRINERARRLDFELINPGDAGQRFHSGSIRMIGRRGHTIVVQEARFDFPGASLWVHYPWRGGMQDMLRYTAQWERRTAARVVRSRSPFRVPDESDHDPNEVTHVR